MRQPFYGPPEPFGGIPVDLLNEESRLLALRRGYLFDRDKNAPWLFDRVGDSSPEESE